MTNSLASYFNQMRYVRNFQDMERHENFSSSMVRREKGTRESFSLADCTSVAWRHRNREKPNLSSLPPDHQAYSAPRFAVFLYAIPPAFPSLVDEDTDNCRRPVWNFYNVAVYVPPVPKTAIPGRVDFSLVWCDSYYRRVFLFHHPFSRDTNRAWHFRNAYFTELLRGGDRRING